MKWLSDLLDSPIVLVIAIVFWGMVILAWLGG